MKILGVSVSLPKKVDYQGKTIETGIFKEPVSGRVAVGEQGLEGDGQADLKVHGGTHMAVYAYPIEHYEPWERELGRRGLPHGQFGENLTVSGIMEEQARVGDLFRVGTSLLEVTHPRFPCFKLPIRMELGPEFIKRFLESGRLGFYLRVRETGGLGAGDSMQRISRVEGAMSIREFIDAYRTRERGALQRMLELKELKPSWREWAATQLHG